MPDATPYLVSDLSDGRNGIDAPTSDAFPFTQSAEAVNVDYRYRGLGRKRGGTFDVIANTTGNTWANPIVNLFRHVPSGDETQGQVWGVDTSSPAVVQALAAGTVWAVVGPTTFARSSAAENYLQHWVSFNGKLYMFYLDTGQNRLKVFDASLNAERWVGLSVNAGAAPTVANQGGGAYAAVPRWYRVRWVTASFARMSEPSPSVAFTPSGAGLSARVTAPVAPGEGEAAWVLEASPDNINFYRLATVVLPTAFFDDTTAPAGYPAGQLSEISGTFTLVPAARYGCTDGNRLVMGNFPQSSSATGVTGLDSRVMWTPVLGSLDEGDDERVFQTATIKPYMDLDNKNGGGITSIQQINGVVYVFKLRQVWRLTPTEDLYKPYTARRLSGTIGAVSNKAVALGEDASGNPALYFMSHKGPYRVGPGGIEYLGRDIEDLTRTQNGVPNINTAATKVIAHSVFHQDLFQWWVWWASGSSNLPDSCCVLDVKKATRQDEYGVRHGWTRITGLLATATCSTMGPYVLGATASLRPWVGLPANAKVGIADRDDLYTDMGTTYQAYVMTRSVAPFGRFLTVHDSVIVAKHFTTGGMSLRETKIRDFGQESSTADVAFTNAESGQTIVRQINSVGIANAYALQIQIGDAAVVNSAWEIRQLYIPVQLEGPISG